MMNDIELRQKIEQQLAQLPPGELSLVSEFLNSLQNRRSNSNRTPHQLPPIKRGSNAVDLLTIAGTWQGSDLDECLSFVHETAPKPSFNHLTPCIF